MARLEISSFNSTGREQRIDENFQELYGDVANVVAEIDYIQSTWASTAATVTAGAGTYTSATGTMKYKQIGKTVHIQLSAMVTTVGTGTGVLKVQIPFAADGTQSLSSYSEAAAHAGILRCLLPNAEALAYFQLVDATTGAAVDVAQDGTSVVAGGTYVST